MVECARPLRRVHSVIQLDSPMMMVLRPRVKKDQQIRWTTWIFCTRSAYFPDALFANSPHLHQLTEVAHERRSAPPRSRPRAPPLRAVGTPARASSWPSSCLSPREDPIAPRQADPLVESVPVGAVLLVARPKILVVGQSLVELVFQIHWCEQWGLRSS